MNSPYYLIPISAAITLFYLLGCLLVQAGIISTSTHRRFWNFTLLFNFLGCAVLGILLAININYKLEWTFVKPLLTWHVQLGIAMSAVALIHTLWHGSYFSKHLSFKQIKWFANNDFRKNQPLTASFALGVLSVSLQVLLIRQFTKVFQGNEFLITWTIGIWMVLSGMGAFLGSRTRNIHNTNRTIANSLWFMYISTATVIFLSGEIKQTFYPTGVLIAPHHVILMVTLMMCTTAIPSGLTYAMLTHLTKNKYPTIYALEALGSLFGGLLLSLVIIWILNTYLAVLAIGIVVGFILAYPFNKPVKFLIPMALIATGISMKIFNIDIYAESILLPSQKVLSVTDSPYGSLTVTGSEGQINFFENGSMLFGTQNTIQCEEAVHYAMAQLADPQRVLLIAGGYTGLINELEKYKQIEIDYVEPNPHLFNISKKYGRQSIPLNVNVIVGDIRNYLRKLNKKYDLTIVATPEPTSLEQNRYFTLEFISLVKQHLTPQGVLSLSLYGIGNYPSPPKLRVYASITATLRKAFKHVESITGERDYLLSSDRPIRIDMAQLLSERQIGEANLYVRPDYINDEYIAERNQFFHEQISVEQKLNTDNHPWPILQYTLNYLSMFSKKIWVLLAVGILILLSPAAFFNVGTRSMYVIGFAGSSIQTLYLLTLQIGTGVLYGAIGSMIAIFMGGLAGGSILHERFSNLRSVHAHALLIGSFLVLLLLWLMLIHIPKWLLITTIGLGTLMASVAVGYLYIHITGSNTSKNQPAKTYSADLLGSAAGIVIVTLLLIPSIGFEATITILVIGLSLFLLLYKS